MSESVWSSSDDAFRYGASLLTDGDIQLREQREPDLAALVLWWNSPEWAGLQQHVIKPRPEAKVEEMFRAWGANASAGDAGFSIVRRDGGELLGQLSLHGASLPERSATLGIILKPDHVGEGIGPRALRLALAYGFRELGLNRVELRVWAFNSRAIRAYEKVGFQIEGRRREIAFHDGQFHDELIMGVLAREFLAG